MAAHLETSDPTVAPGRRSARLLGRASTLLVLAWVATIAFRPVINNDYWLHLRMGEDLLTSGRFPHVDTWSAVAAGRPYLAKEWLAGVVFALLDDLGPLAPTLLRVALGLGTVLAMLAALPRRLRGTAVTVPLLLLCTYVAASRFIVRPHLFSILFASLLLAILAHWRRAPSTRLHWLLPPLLALWVNTHGGFSFGLVLIAVVLAGSAAARLVPALARKDDPSWSRIRSLAIAFALACGATLLNPYGLELVRLSLSMSARNEFLRERITEWQSPFTASFRGDRQIFFWGWIAVLAALWSGIALTLRRRTAVELGLALCVTVVSLRANRFVAYAALGGFPILVASWSERIGARRRPLAELGATALLIATAVLHGFAYGSTRRPLGWGYGGTQPFACVAFMKEHGLEGVLYNDLLMDGSLVIRELAPRVRPTMDARMEVIGQELYERWRGCHQSERSFLEYLDLVDARLALISLKSRHLAETLDRRPEWELVFAGESRFLFRRVE